MSTEDLIEACSAQLNANSSSSSGDNRSKDVKWRDEKSRERHVCRENVSPGYRLTVLKEKEKGEGEERRRGSTGGGGREEKRRGERGKEKRRGKEGEERGEMKEKEGGNGERRERERRGEGRR